MKAPQWWEEGAHTIRNSSQTTAPSPGDAKDRITFDDNAVAMTLYGQNNANLKLIERELGVAIHARGNELTLMGAADIVALARSLLEQLYSLGKKGAPLDDSDIARAVSVLRGDRRAPIKEIFNDQVLTGSRPRPVAPKGLAP